MLPGNRGRTAIVVRSPVAGRRSGIRWLLLLLLLLLLLQLLQVSNHGVQAVRLEQ